MSHCGERSHEVGPSVLDHAQARLTACEVRVNHQEPVVRCGGVDGINRCRSAWRQARSALPIQLDARLVLFVEGPLVAVGEGGGPNGFTVSVQGGGRSFHVAQLGADSFSRSARLLGGRAEAHEAGKGQNVKLLHRCRFWIQIQFVAKIGSSSLSRSFRPKGCEHPQVNASSNAESGGQEHTRLRSPWALSTRATELQNFRPTKSRTGYTAFSRLYTWFHTVAVASSTV